MFESAGGALTEADRVAELRRLVARVASWDPESDPAAAVDVIRLLEELKSAAAAAQAAQTARFVQVRRDEQSAAGVLDERVGRGITSEVALARRCSTHRASQYVGWARILTADYPQTFAALRRGETTEWRATLVVRETAYLSDEHRVQADAELAARLGGWGDRKTEIEARLLAYRLDPHAYVNRIGRAADDRRVTLRPAPDTMTRLTALLPVTQGVAALAALTQAADSARALGDERTRGQVMADTLVERLTGQATADAVPVTVNLIMTDRALLHTGNGRDEPAIVSGHGPIPAPHARQLIAEAGPDTQIWLRRLFTDPAGRLVSMETSARCFTPSQREFIGLRDQACRTPYCDAPAREVDHVNPAIDGGPTSLANAQALCQPCNHAKQAPGWTATVAETGDIVTTTPTGHSYRSRAPALPR